MAPHARNHLPRKLGNLYLINLADEGPLGQPAVYAAGEGRRRADGAEPEGRGGHGQGTVHRVAPPARLRSRVRAVVGRPSRHRRREDASDHGAASDRPLEPIGDHTPTSDSSVVRPTRQFRMFRMALGLCVPLVPARQVWVVGIEDQLEVLLKNSMVTRLEVVPLPVELRWRSTWSSGGDHGFIMTDGSDSFGGDVRVERVAQCG